MTDRIASCSCGKLSVRTRGEPVRVSIYGVRKHAWVRLPDDIECLD